MDPALLNSLTKYPSIPTYHAMGDKGRLTETVQVDFAGTATVATEKIDGTNVRIVLTPDGWYLGSREDLLTFRDDRIANPSQGIVAALRETADAAWVRWVAGWPEWTHLSRVSCAVVYGEVYGIRGLPASKQYGAQLRGGFRVFDAWSLPLDLAAAVPGYPDPAAIARWRERGGQPFLPWDELRHLCLRLDLAMVPTPPPMGALPVGVAATAEWLDRAIPTTLAALDSGAVGDPEGIVVRTSDRSRIAKLRLADYRRAVGPHHSGPKGAR